MKITEKTNILSLLEQTDSIKYGHFELSSGLHSNQYFQCAKLLQYPELAEQMGLHLAQFFNSSNIDLVIGPALGGIIIAYETARALDTKAIFAERKDGILCLRRGFEIARGNRVLIVEDVITTAKSVKETIGVVESFGGIIAGIGCIVDRSQKVSGLDDIKSLIQINPEVYEPSECPLCKQGIPSEKPGSRVKS